VKNNKHNTNSFLSSYQKVYLIAGSFIGNTKTLLVIYLLTFIYFLLALYTYISQNDSEAFVFLFSYLFIFTSPFIIFIFYKYFRLTRKFQEWNKEYLHSSYTLIFDTTLPKGNTVAEKILYLASHIFPSLREDYYNFDINPFTKLKYLLKKRFFKLNSIYQKHLNYKLYNNVILDLVLHTPDGYFIVKNYGEFLVTSEDLKSLTRIIKNKFRDKLYRRKPIYRVICVTKNYNKDFLERNSLEKIMTEELKSDLKIDLIVEEDIGFSVLWVG
jgi:hypothetical protein